MPRSLWKGIVNFGLLTAPVALYPATHRDEIDFDWLRRDTLQPVGYKRIVKETGEEVGSNDIVKAVKYQDRYVVLSDEEIKAANVKSTHAIDIVGFTDPEEVSFLFYEMPYYLAPAKGGEKVYALLRESLRKARKIGIASIVLHNKQHLAALIATPKAIVLNTLRWAADVRDADQLSLPGEGVKEAALRPKELTMATQLIERMVKEWNPVEFRDTFRDDIMALVKKKYDQGAAETITEVAIAPPQDTAEESDLTELLRKSLEGIPGLKRSKTGGRAPLPSTRKPATRVRGSSSMH